MLLGLPEACCFTGRQVTAQRLLCNFASAVFSYVCELACDSLQYKRECSLLRVKLAVSVISACALLSCIHAPQRISHHSIDLRCGVAAGTGKTLVARAMANQTSVGDRRISFFMVKGAQLLSKWLGESERQLRLIFEQARRMAPSIVFFDEFDGIAPVRSTKQDAIHSSIVATLLALLDGLDDRGQVIVIGATNRPDAIDPALRRPGRFDRELYFPLPSATARRSILDIHTRSWTPPLTPDFKNALARATVGYCGADIAALCTEAALRAVRRRFRAIYDSDVKLDIDPESVNVSLGDFATAMKDCVPAAARSATSGQAAPVPPHLQPLLCSHLTAAAAAMLRVFPFVKKASMAMLTAGAGGQPVGAAAGSLSSATAAGGAPFTSSSLQPSNASTSSFAAPSSSSSSAPARGSIGSGGAALPMDAEELEGGGYDSDNSAAMAAVYGQLNSDECVTCGQPGDLVCCDTCTNAYHLKAPDGSGGKSARNKRGKKGAAGTVRTFSASAVEDSERTQADSAPSVYPSLDEVEVTAGGTSSTSDSSSSAGHPGSCVPATCPLPDVSTDAPWSCPACYVAKAGTPSTLSGDRGTSSGTQLRASAVNVDAVLSAAGKRACFRPRLVLYTPHSASDHLSSSSGSLLLHTDGDDGSSGGASSLPVMLARALLHVAEELPAVSIDMPSLLADANARTAVEALSMRVGEARRSAPSILFLPRADEWWASADETLRGALVHMCDSIPSDSPVLLLSTLSGKVGAAHASSSSAHGALLTLSSSSSSSLSAAASTAWNGLRGGGGHHPFHAAAAAAAAPAPSRSQLYEGGFDAHEQQQEHTSGDGAEPHLPPQLCRLLLNAPAFSGAEGSSSDAVPSRVPSAVPLTPFSAEARAAFFGALWGSLLPRPSSLGLPSHSSWEVGCSSSSSSAMAAAPLFISRPSSSSSTAAYDSFELENALVVAQRRHQRRELKRQREEVPLKAAPPPAPPAPPTAAELAAARRAVRDSESKYLASLRLGLRSVLDDLARDPKYRPFAVPVDEEDVPDYYSTILVPMDFSTMAEKLEAGAYLCYEDFSADLRLIHENAREYNPGTERDKQGRRIIQRAAAILDFADLEFTDYNRRVGGKLAARCTRIRARRSADGELVPARTYMTWGVPRGVSRSVSEADVLARVRKAYGSDAVGGGSAAATTTAAAAAASLSSEGGAARAEAGAGAAAARAVRRSSRGAGDDDPAEKYVSLELVPRKRLMKGRGAASTSLAETASSTTISTSADAPSSSSSSVGGGEGVIELSEASVNAAAVDDKEHDVEGEIVTFSSGLCEDRGSSAAAAAASLVGAAAESTSTSVIGADDDEIMESTSTSIGDITSTAAAAAAAEEASSVSFSTADDAILAPPHAKRARSPLDHPTSSSSGHPPSSSASSSSSSNEDIEEAEGAFGAQTQSQQQLMENTHAAGFSASLASSALVHSTTSSSSSPSAFVAAAAAATAASMASAAAAAAAEERAVNSSARLDAELHRIRAVMAEFKALQPRAGALLQRAVAGTQGWGLDRLDRLRHQLSVIAQTAAERAAAAARHGGWAWSRSQVLDEVEEELDVWGVHA